MLHPSMLEPENCPSEANFSCLSMLDARIFIFEHARARSMLDFLILDTNQLLKIGKFWQKQSIFSQIPGQKLDHVEFSNARACSSSNFDFQACSTLLSTRIFIFEHARARSMLDFFMLDATLLIMFRRRQKQLEEKKLCKTFQEFQ